MRFYSDSRNQSEGCSAPPSTLFSMHRCKGSKKRSKANTKMLTYRSGNRREITTSARDKNTQLDSVLSLIVL